MLPQYDQWEMIGCGGMGAVYKARQTSLDRLVAIKVLPPQVAEDEAEYIERFKNEARTMAKMNHPAIVAVYDFGETRDELLNKVSWPSWNKLTESTTIVIVASVLFALVIWAMDSGLGVALTNFYKMFK